MAETVPALGTANVAIFKMARLMAESVPSFVIGAAVKLKISPE